MIAACIIGFSFDDKFFLSCLFSFRKITFSYFSLIKLVFVSLLIFLTFILPIFSTAIFWPSFGIIYDREFKAILMVFRHIFQSILSLFLILLKSFLFKATPNNPFVNLLPLDFSTNTYSSFLFSTFRLTLLIVCSWSPSSMIRVRLFFSTL
jgi:hypothetical protein